MTEIEKRLDIERKVVRHLIEVAKKRGYTLTRIWDGECYERPKNVDEALDIVFSVDECQMAFKHPDDAKAHTAVIVLGNDGWDCIADSSVGEGWDGVMDEVSVYTDKMAT